MQAGATFAHNQHHVNKQGLPDRNASLRTARGLVEEIPFMKEMGVIDSLLADDYKGRKAVGQLISGTVIPQGVRNVAKWTDPLPEPYYRSPKTVMDVVRQDIPGLREKVRFKGPGLENMP